MSFKQVHQQYNWDEVQNSILQKNSSDVERALQSAAPTLEDFKALISPAAEPYLEQMAQKSHQLTLKRFGKTMQMYIPLYLSNECANGCIYCGFNCKNKINRVTLSKEEILQEAAIIKEMGFEHVLLVTGEHPKACGIDYISEVVDLLRDSFANISVEIAPMDVPDYERMQQKGLNTVYIYQETYNKARYPIYHPKGKKSDFNYRLETPDRLGEAEIHRIGVGCLLGLEDWRTDTFFTALHLNYLEQKYWKTKYSISFPRLRPHAGSFEPNSIVNDKQLVQLICAYRIFNQELEISLSTRENPVFRNNMVKLGVTSMSAGSKTEPGGYANPDKELKQFEVSDSRSSAEVSQMIIAQGYEAVWKDWDACFTV
ncbi:2-iminoacetate synthase ThiH [Saccharicrinis aurantiacus]|uniref:2-iminoacetate synthase ThiH n=1 Tax=Saccharicrinis aurantiacus TaxID=1849719 RepID=UPI000950255F|nr:2-iminoacetate synthase ThiH [Saccharicrinis aurantiacus]